MRGVFLAIDCHGTTEPHSSGNVLLMDPSLGSIRPGRHNHLGDESPDCLVKLYGGFGRRGGGEGG